MKLHLSEPPRRYVFTAKDEEAPMAVVELIIISDVLKVDGGRPAAYLHKCYTDDAFQGRGYASKLVRKAMDKAKEQGCHKIFVVCKAETVAFYERFGFKPDGMELVKRFD